MSPGPQHYDVLVAGGGVPGLALACAVADALGPQISVAVADPLPFRAEQGPTDVRASAISAGSKRMLEVLHVWQAIADQAQQITRVDITDSRLDDILRPVLVSYDNTVDGGEPATWIVENGVLAKALREAAGSRHAVTLIGETSVRAFRTDAHAVIAELSNGDSASASLLVAADGRNSRLRAAANIGVVGTTYAQIAIVVIVHHEKPHEGRAVQHFLPGGPFAILPMTGRRSCITWTEDEDVGRAIMALDDAGFLGELEKRFSYRLGAITQVGPRRAWPLDMHLARALVADRFALVGDAAHSVHPIAGQGLNLALRDVAALAEVVADAARLGLDIGAATTLERYERWRRADSALSAATFDALNRLFSNTSTVPRTVRGIGLGMVERLPALKQAFVTEAAGLAGDVPKLLRGLSV
ncbi:MAG TPA: FAD-dependent monooxygenase [Hyphomicrobiaceae bacterium]|nr:FAD-dependent monooxygenase [Hyphomicrobiaceae bacterium]